MDFLSNLTSLALGEIPVIKPILSSLTSQSNDDGKYFNEVYPEKTISFDSNDTLKEKHTQQEKKFNSFASEPKEFQDNEKIIPVKGEKIFSFEKNFSDKSKNISGEIIDLTKSIKPVEQNIRSNHLSFAEVNKEEPFETTAVTLTTDVLQSINDLFVGDETVLKLKNNDNKTKNKVEMQSINPQSKPLKNILDYKNNNSGFDDDGSNSAKTSTVKINIGRIEVRAVYPEQAIASKTEQNKPQLSLNEYLRSFNESKR